MKASVQGFFDERTFTASYVVSDPKSKRAAIIDPVLDFAANAGRIFEDSANQIVEFVRRNDLSVDWILETHVHADHLSAAPYLRNALGGKIAIGAHVRDVQAVFAKVFNTGDEFACDGSQFDHTFRDGETFSVGEVKATALHTPGHTPACMTYLIGDAGFVGDTLFMPDYGTARCDFPGGDAAQLFRSIQKIFALPDETRLFMCHDYKAPGRDEYAWETTVGEEKARNIHVHEGISEAEFVKMRNERDATLDMPALILPSVQVNMRAGDPPPPETNGVSYLKLPLNQF